MRRAITVLVFLAITAAAALIGARFMPGEWYLALRKPAWTPPGWLFGPVWTVLYVMIAIAGSLAWQALGAGSARVAWMVQIVLNGLWSWLMFGLHRIGLALVDILALWLAIGAFVVLAWGPARSAAWLFLPYWAWVTFATALNFAIWHLNG